MRNDSRDEQWGGGDPQPDDSDYEVALPALDVLVEEAKKTLRIVMKGHGGRNSTARLGAARAMLELAAELESAQEPISDKVKPIRTVEELARIAEILRLDRKRERQA